MKSHHDRPSAVPASREATSRRKSTHDQQPVRSTLIYFALVLVAGLLAYSSSFVGDFVFDDVTEIESNDNLAKVWPPQEVLDSGNRLPVRPLPQWTFGVQSLVTGRNLASFHAVNLAIHLASGMLLLLLVKWSLDFVRERIAPLDESARCIIATSIASLWVAHPLTTQAVTYIYQRIESMVVLGMLASLVCFAASMRRPASPIWLLLSVVASILAMLCKEVAITLPLLVYLYDATFVSRSFGEPLAKRWKYHLAMHATIVVLLGVVLAERGDYAEFTEQKHSSWEYARSQPLVILHYLRLAFLPIYQCFDYTWPVQPIDATMFVSLFVVLAMFVGAALLLWRRHPLGFVAMSFFILLAPSSSVVPVIDLAFEHRMYLPLAAVLTLVIAPLGLWQLQLRDVEKESPRQEIPSRVWLKYSLVMGVILTLLVALTFQRNMVYRDRQTLWEDVVQKLPQNARAWANLARIKGDRGNFEDAYRDLQRSLKELPNVADTHGQLASVCLALGRRDEALRACERGIEIDPDKPLLYYQLGLVLRGADDERALAALEKAVELAPNYGDAHNNLGAMLIRRDPQRAHEHLLKAIEIRPTNYQAWINLGNLLGSTGNYRESIAAFDRALSIAKDHPLAMKNRATVLQLQQQSRSTP